MPSYHIKEDNWILEIRVFLGISDDSWLYNMPSKIYIHLRSVHRGKVYPLHLSNTPEQHLAKNNASIQFKLWNKVHIPLRFIVICLGCVSLCFVLHFVVFCRALMCFAALCSVVGV